MKKIKEDKGGKLNTETLNEIIDFDNLLSSALREQYRLAPNNCYADTINKVALGVCYCPKKDFCLSSCLIDFLRYLRNDKGYDCYVGLIDKDLVNTASLATVEKRTAHVAWHPPVPDKNYFGRYVFFNKAFEIVEKDSGGGGGLKEL